MLVASCLVGKCQQQDAVGSHFDETVHKFKKNCSRFVKMHFMNIQIHISARNSEEVQKGFNNNIQSTKAQSDDKCQVSKVKAQAFLQRNLKTKNHTSERDTNS